MPEIGEILTAKELGVKGTNPRIYSACLDCGRKRWVHCIRGKPDRVRCQHCALKGSRSSSWKGGRLLTTSGYVSVWVAPTDFFFPMASKQGYVMEHRLVMAKHVARCLLPWEVVHHRNGIKDDNRIENLELLSSGKLHLVDAETKRYIKSLLKKIENLKSENIELKRIKHA